VAKLKQEEVHYTLPEPQKYMTAGERIEEAKKDNPELAEKIDKE